VDQLGGSHGRCKQALARYLAKLQIGDGLYCRLDR
jgi:hypothetical protein